MKDKRTIEITKVNLLGLLFLPVLSIFFIVYYYFWKFPNFDAYIDSPLRLFYLLLLALFSIFIHELIHAIFFAAFSKNGWRDVKIGVLWRKLTPYAHCRKPLLVFQYRIALLMPGIVLGLVPIIAGMVFGLFFTFFFGAFMLFSAGGDIIIYIMSLKIPKNKMLLDHPTECGFYIIDKQENHD